MSEYDLICLGGVFIPRSGLSQTQRHQIEEELLEKEREFACLIYAQRDRERLLK